MSWWLMTSASEGASFSVDRKNREVRMAIRSAGAKPAFYSTGGQTGTPIARRCGIGTPAGAQAAGSKAGGAAASATVRFATPLNCEKMRSINQFAGFGNA
jgi:hypothetical protein